MANEYLTRTPTSTGNRKVWTWSGWFKKSANNTVSSNGQMTFFRAGDTLFRFDDNIGYDDKIRFYAEDTSPATILNLIPSYIHRDNSGWQHLLVNFNTTQSTSVDRASIYVNGVKLTKFEVETRPSFDAQCDALISGTAFNIGLGVSGEYLKGQLTDCFFIDGQALTPDVFGFYKQGNGYISAGSTQATDFRPGQWVPKTPRVIKTEINRRGGFGVNGFYLPMNDSSNFGADFHTTPNSIITLKGEDLPQPRNGAPTTTDAYVSQLRTDPYAANLVLALPFVSGGLESGFGDYSATIKGSGSAKSITNTGVSIASTASYYGSGGYFDSGDYLFTPNVSDFQFGTGDFTMEAWTYSFSGSWSIVAAQGTTGDAGRTVFAINNTGAVVSQIGSQNLISSSGIATSAQWNHIALVRKNGVGTIYLNGVCVGINTVYTNSIQNTTLYVGSDQGWTNTSSKMYLQDLRVYKGVAKYKGGFDVPKPYTPVGIATWRAVPDTTANNFATLNAVDKLSNSILSNGNLSFITNNGNRTGAKGNIGVSTGKWYFELYKPTVNSGSIGFGTDTSSLTQDGYVGDGASWGYLTTGEKRNGGTSSSYGSSWATGDIVSAALDLDNGQISFYKNGVNQGTAFTNVQTYNTFLVPIVYTGNQTSSVDSINFGQNPTFSGNTTAGTFTDSNGKGLFKYQPPSGFLALCEDNLPTPAIKNPGEHFKSVLWTGSGASRNVVGVGFTPDLVWIKDRTGTAGHALHDSVRLPSLRLNSSSTNEESSESSSFISFSSDGFSLAGNDTTYNNTARNYVAWCWRAGAGTTSTNTNGSITSVVSVNQDAGFSIATYTGTGSALTFGHGLGKVPAFAIFKYRSGPSGGWAWVVYHKSLPTNYYVYLQSTVAQQNLTGVFTTAPTSTLFSLGTEGAVNTNNNNMLCYSWAEIEGFSKFGSYVGNGSADGPFVYCGFKPALVIFKRTDSTDNWRMNDNARGAANGTNFVLYPNLSNIEDQANDHLDYLSNGFKLRGTNNNASGGSYIFAAFAESPFQTANAK